MQLYAISTGYCDKVKFKFEENEIWVLLVWQDYENYEPEYKQKTN